MADLDADIARIAALRGRKVEDYTTNRRRYVDVHRLEGLLHMTPETRLDLQCIDQLPPASRALIVNWERQINAIMWLELLQEHEDEAFVIRTFRAWYAEKFGRQGDGPQVKPDARRRRRFS